jgi:hypothetical protein
MPEFITEEKLKEMLADVPPEQHEALKQRLTVRGYEIENYSAEFSFKDALSNVDNSTAEFVKAMWSAVKNPGTTVNSMSSLAKGGLRKAAKGLGLELPTEGLPGPAGVGGSEMDEKLLDSVIGFYKDRYGSMDKFLDTIEKDPVGFSGDVASLMGGTGVAVSGVGKISKVAPIIKAGKNIRTFSRYFEPSSIASKTARQFNSLVGINKLFRKTKRSMMERGLTVSREKLAKLAEESHLPLGQKASDFLTEHGVYGSLEQMSDQLGNIRKRSREILDAELGRLTQKYSPDMAKKLLLRMKKEFKPLVKTGELSQEYAETLGIFDDYITKLGEGAEGLTLPELNNLKRKADEFLNLYKAGGEVREGVTKGNIESNVRELRRFIESEAANQGVKDVKKLNRQVQISAGLKESIDHVARAGVERQNVMQRIVVIGAITGGGLGVAFDQPKVAGFIGAYLLGTEAIKNPRIASFLSTRIHLLEEGNFKALQRGVERGVWGEKGKKVVKQILKEIRTLSPEIRAAGIVQQFREGQQQGAEGVAN